MTKTKRSYDKAFKLEAVRLSETSSKSVRQVETDLDRNSPEKVEP